MYLLRPFSNHGFCVALLSLLFPAQALCASFNLDSLQTELQHCTQDSQRCVLLEEIWAIQVHENLDSAFSAASHWLACATQRQDTFAMIMALHGLTQTTAMEANYEASLEFAIRACGLADTVGDSSWMYQPYNDLGILHTKHGRPAQALVYHQKALSVASFDPRGADLSIAASYHNLGNTYRMLDSVELAFDYLHKARDLYQQLNKPGRVMSMNIVLAEHEMERGDTAAAAPYLNILKQDLERQLSVYHRAYICDLQGAYHTWANNLSEANAYLSIGLALADSLGHNDLQMYLHQHLHALHAKQQHQELAIHHLRRHYEIKEEIYNTKTSNRINELQIAFESEHHKLEIAELSATKAQREVTIKNQRAQMAGLAGGTLLLLVLGVFGWSRYRLRKEAEMQKALAEQQKEGTRAILVAQEEERKRIARDLHDGVGQMIATLKLTWETVNERNKLPESKQLSDLLSTCSKEVRSLAHRMMPVTLEEKGLQSALNELLRNSLGLNQIDYEFDAINIAERLPAEYEICLYRVTQELLSNMLKHAQPSEVQVQLYRANNNIILNVADDSSRFSVSENRGLGQGLLNMMTRVKSMNGHLQFEPASMGGMSTIVKLPAA